MLELQLSLPGRKYKLPVTVVPEGVRRLRLKYAFSKEMNAEIKTFQGAKYHGFDDPNRKYWTIEDSPRNWFCLRYLAGENMYAAYDAPLTAWTTQEYLDSWEHQVEFAREALTRKRKIFAYEMGTGKTRGAMMTMDLSGTHEWWWIGTKGSLREMSREWNKWKPKVTPKFMTYDELKKVIENWPEGQKAPQGVIFDEASKIKTPTAQRSQSAAHLSISIERDWGDKGYCILMTGTPAPKDPCDWWHLCEVAKPGFIREGTYQKFKARLSYSVQKQGEYGIYPEHVTWWDNELKCKHCGKLKDDNVAHDTEAAIIHGIDFHVWEKSTNEVETLYLRMRGLVTIKFKRDVMKFLPEKRYHCEELKASPSTLRTARTLLKTARNVITGLTLLRELSDGFQYVDKAVGMDTCSMCNGTGRFKEWYLKSKPDAPVFDVPAEHYDDYASRDIVCPTCEGKGQAQKYERTTQEVPCPKDDYFTDLLDNHEDAGRFVCYAGFTGSIDRCISIAHRNGWATIRVDSRGWHATDYQNLHIDPLKIFGKDRGDPFLTMFQEGKSDFPRVCYIGHAKSGGMGVTLTASPGIYFFSNSFDGEDRFQAEDRIHRKGMDVNRGATIYDAIHLPSDKLILENITKKRDLQNMTLGVFQQKMEEYIGDRVQ